MSYIGQVGGAIAGNLTQQSRRGFWQRRLIQWEVPHKFQFIEMYINPQNIRIASQKQTNEVRTKGGFMLQYWGEMFDRISLTGHTGSGGIEGINVLREVYRTEYQKFEGIIGLLLNLATGTTHGLPSVKEVVHIFRVLSRYGEKSEEEQDPLSPSSFKTFWSNVGRSFAKGHTYFGGRQRGTLAELATSVVMHYQNVSYRGYFTSMNVTEDATMPGIFQYDMEFSVIETYGERKNFMPWHRKATAGKAKETPFDRAQDELMTERERELQRTATGRIADRTAFANSAGTLTYREAGSSNATGDLFT
jgi:hypothetical protein